MATIPIIQLLRNNNIYSSRDAARSALEGQKKNVPDGGVILARYSGTTGEQMIIKTLAGFVSNISTPENATVTIIDVEGASENVQDAITSAINNLNKVDAEEVGQYVSSVSEENGIITVTRTPLPSIEKHAPVGEAVTAVTQTNGKIGVEYGSINALNVSVTDSIDRFQTDNVEGVLNELYTGLNEAMSGVGMMIDGKINTLNSRPSFKSQHIIVGVNQINGRINSVFVQEQNIASEAALTAHTADTTVHVTQADKDKWNTPTDLSNYYTKSEVDKKDAAINSTIESYGQVTSQALNDLGTRMDDYGKVTSQSLNDLSTKFGDYYTKTEVDTAISNVDVTSQLQNYYTKTEVDSKDATLQTALDALDAHVSENEDIVSQSLNDLNNRIGNTYVKSYIDALEARIAELETKFLNMENNGLQAGEY